MARIITVLWTFGKRIRMGMRRNRLELTEKELEVFCLVSAGFQHREVGQRMNPPIKASTVKTHMRRIMDKLDVYSSQEALVEALHCQVIELSQIPRLKVILYPSSSTP